MIASAYTTSLRVSNISQTGECEYAQHGGWNLTGNMSQTRLSDQKRKHIMAIAGKYRYLLFNRILHLHSSFMLLSHSELRNKSSNLLFPIKYAVPKSWKISQWLSHSRSIFPQSWELKNIHLYSFCRSPHWPRPLWLMILSRQPNSSSQILTLGSFSFPPASRKKRDLPEHWKTSGFHEA